MPLKRPDLSAKSPTEQTKLLIIDDSDDHWLIIKKVFQRLLPQASLQRVSTAQQGIDLLQEWTFQEWEFPKLILLDLYLPTEEEGWRFLRHIKATQPINRIPVVLLSASSRQQDIEKAYQLGAAAYLVKPTTAPEWEIFTRFFHTYWWETATLPPTHISF